MQPPITIASGVTTSPFLVSPDGWVIIEAGSTSVTVQYTTGTTVDIANGTASYVTVGTFTGFTAIRADEELAEVYVKLTTSGGSATYHVEGQLSRDDRMTLRGYKRMSMNGLNPTYSLDSNGNVQGLVGPDGKLVKMGILLSQNAIPMVYPSSGSVGNNGALSGITALPYSTFPQPAYIYFKAGALFAGSAEGLYYSSITSTTTATVFNNIYTNGTPVIPASPTPFVTTGPGAYTQNAGSTIPLLSVPVPANSLGINGRIRTHLFISANNTVGGKTPRILYGNQAYYNAGLASWNTSTLALDLINRGATNSQVATPLNIVSEYGGTQGQPYRYFNVDSTLTQNVVVDINMATATDYAILEAHSIEILPSS